MLITKMTINLLTIEQTRFVMHSKLYVFNNYTRIFVGYLWVLDLICCLYLKYVLCNERWMGYVGNFLNLYQ